MTRDLWHNMSDDTRRLNPDLAPEGDFRAAEGGVTDKSHGKAQNKYNARRTVVDGIKFASKAEARRYQELQLMEEAGEIADLELQPEFILQRSFTDAWDRTHRSIKYTADFKYLDGATNRWVVEDVKGQHATETEAFSMRFKFAQYQNPDIKFVKVRR